jgi:hypothetical protein
MEGIGDVIRKKAGARANRRLHSEAHVLADEISAHFGEPKRFAMYLGVIKRLGVARARAIFARVKSEAAGVQNPRKLFMWLSRNPGEDSPGNA